MNKLGEKMRKRRQELGLTPRRAAEGADMSTDTWKRIEGSFTDPTCGELENISNVLRVAPHILAGWRPQKAGIIMRREGNDVVIEWEKPFRFVSSEILSTDGYIRIEFEEVEG